ncbi:MAG TPA: hypothetical protein VMX79_00230 [bacterium]|nr:hypothetical protein [bacterium]
MAKEEPVEISMTTFINYVISSGTAKITKVRDAKKQYGQKYDPRADFWKGLRDRIEGMHKNGEPKSVLDSFLDTLSDAKKKELYDNNVQGYKRWLGRKKVLWIGPKRGTWAQGGLRIRVNPEIGVNVNGNDHIIKLWFKAEQLSKNRIDLILYLLDKKTKLNPATVVGVLDVQRAYLIKATRRIPNIEALLRAEALSFLEIWKDLR